MKIEEEGKEEEEEKKIRAQKERAGQRTSIITIAVSVTTGLYSILSHTMWAVLWSIKIGENIALRNYFLSGNISSLL